MRKQLSDYRPGDPDTTPDDAELMCQAVIQHDSGTYTCTREAMHVGVHAAGTGSLIVATWDGLGNLEEFRFDSENVTGDHVPDQYVASWAYAGCLPDTPAETFTDAGEAWAYIIETYTAYEDDVVEDTVRNFRRLEEAGDPGRVVDTDGMIYAVEDTWLMTCGSCGRKFPDIYPAGRCPYEYAHPTVVKGMQLAQYLDEQGQHQLAIQVAHLASLIDRGEI